MDANTDRTGASTTHKLAAVAASVMVVVAFLLGQRYDRPPGLEPPF